MEKGERNIIPRTAKPPAEAEVLLQWGNRKRLRCVRVRGNNPAEVSSPSRIRRRITSRFLTLSHTEASFAQPTSRYTRNPEAAARRSEGRKSPSGSQEKDERCYSTRGSTVEENGKISVDGGAGDKGVDQENHPHHQNNNNNNNNNNISKKMVWPKVCIGLSSKEKEEDFMAMKGCKPPQRPKKRAKIVQRTLLLVSPGAWLSEVSLERYQVREKKNSKKKARGLKGMGSVESDSE